MNAAKLKFYRVIVCMFVMTISSGILHGAETRFWTGNAGNMDWFDAGNWSPDDAYPHAGDTVIVNSGSALLTNETAELASFTIANATLTFSNWTAVLRSVEVTLENGGSLTHANIDTNAAPGATNRVYVAASNMFVMAGGSINVSGRGFRAGPGEN